MGMPTGEIIARPMVVRACGCEEEFQHFAVDKYRAQRLAKFQKTRCTKCVAKLNEEQQKAAALLPKKGELLQLLPTGTEMQLTRLPDGKWSGTMVADGLKVEAVGDGTQGVTLALARAWASAKGIVANSAPSAAAPAPAAAPKPAGPPRPRPGGGIPPPRRRF